MFCVKVCIFRKKYTVLTEYLFCVSRISKFKNQHRELKETKGLDCDSGPKVEPRKGLTGGVSAAENFLYNSLSQLELLLPLPIMTVYFCPLNDLLQKY